MLKFAGQKGEWAAKDGGTMAEFHFVRDYVKLVRKLKRRYPIDEAMSRAVGGDYERISDIASDILVEAGLKDGQNLFDFGCGSGRVATGVAKKVQLDKYLGVDIVKDLLSYADSKTPANYQYKLNRSFTLPADDATFDMVCAFSVVTHLLHHESYLYFCEIERILKPGGTAVISFLELAEPAHWEIFNATAVQTSRSKMPHLNAFTERNQLEIMGKHAGLGMRGFIDGTAPINGKTALGQSVIILSKGGA